jgi:hypothetical protein
MTLLLVLHSFLTPVLIAAAVSSALWAAIDTFLVVTCFWMMNYIAVELEFPFGMDSNDLPVQFFQERFNCSLTGLLHEQALKPPDFNFEAASRTQIFASRVDLQSLTDAIHAMQSSQTLMQSTPPASAYQVDGRGGRVVAINLPCARVTPLHDAVEKITRLGQNDGVGQNFVVQAGGLADARGNITGVADSQADVRGKIAGSSPTEKVDDRATGPPLLDRHAVEETAISKNLPQIPPMPNLMSTGLPQNPLDPSADERELMI